MKPIAIFAYDFPHRKTHDFLVDLVSYGFKNLRVLGAPRKDLGALSKPQMASGPIQVFKPLPTAELCDNLGLAYMALDHRDALQISRLVLEEEISLGIISGARILSADIISLFSQGIVNFHPGKIPETSGLDAFSHMIMRGATAGVTTHFVDHRVDAGRLARFHELPIHSDDTPAIVQENVYQLQRMALREFANDIKQGSFPQWQIDRPFKNAPMKEPERQAALALFPLWKANRLIAQRQRSFFHACEIGDIAAVASELKMDPALVSISNEKGWTPLIVACFHQRIEVVKALLEAGADPNRCAAKGTTPLMYAKTKSLHQTSDYRLLKLLIESGADCKRTDGAGMTVLEYVEQAGDAHLAAFIREYI